MVRRLFFLLAAMVIIATIITACFAPGAWWSLVVTGPLILLGLQNSFQRKHAILRNFPLLGYGRYCLEAFRPEIQQYFIESNIDPKPIEREMRALVYQRAKGELETKPFGTERDVYHIGYEWAAHSAAPRPAPKEEPRVLIGGSDCTKRYAASHLNISAMSFGSLSSRAITALNQGAALGGFAHNTGEGSISRYHQHEGDLIWQIGTGYFGCRAKDGGFDVERYAEQASLEQVKMIELKLSQGAKPGHGGVLPGIKVTREIAEARGVPIGETVMSPPAHSTFTTPVGLMEFVQTLRERSGGKPVGIKLCIGRRLDFFAMCKAMIETSIVPDFITIDGGEGGTGAAPLEFTNSLGMPARDAWIFAHSALLGAGLRGRTRIFASGKILSGFHMVRALALGADVCYSARGMMLALGCIQALRCNSDHCPTGVATQNPALIAGLDVADKTKRVFRYHKATIHGCLELIGAMGLDNADELRPHHIYRRVDDIRIRNFAEIYDFLEPGQLLDGSSLPPGLGEEWHAADAHRWDRRPEPGAHGGKTLRLTKAEA